MCLCKKCSTLPSLWCNIVLINLEGCRLPRSRMTGVALPFLPLVTCPKQKNLQHLSLIFFGWVLQYHVCSCCRVAVSASSAAASRQYLFCFDWFLEVWTVLLSGRAMLKCCQFRQWMTSSILLLLLSHLSSAWIDLRCSEECSCHGWWCIDASGLLHGCIRLVGVVACTRLRYYSSEKAWVIFFNGDLLRLIPTNLGNFFFINRCQIREANYYVYHAVVYLPPWCDLFTAQVLE
jgi:hypothetical protein